MRILFAGSPAIAVPSLEAIFNMSQVEIAGVLTNPDTPKGRHGTPLPTDVGKAAACIVSQGTGKDFPIIKTLKIDAFVREQITSLKCDLLISFAYGRLFGPKFLALFPLGGINIHPSLLPKYRGPTPIQAAILNRDAVTGITIQTLAQEMDSGAILAQQQICLTGQETANSLCEIVSVKAAKMLSDVLIKIADGSAKETEQNHGEACYCSLISRDDGIIDWRRSAVEIDARIRAFTPSPLCRTIHNGLELIILKANIFNGVTGAGLKPDSLPGCVLGTDKKDGILIQTGDGILAVTELQYQAKKALFWRDFLNGARNFLGSQIGG